MSASKIPPDPNEKGDRQVAPLESAETTRKVTSQLPEVNRICRAVSVAAIARLVLAELREVA